MFSKKPYNLIRNKKQETCDISRLDFEYKFKNGIRETKLSHVHPFRYPLII